MNSTLAVIQIIISLILTGLVLLQSQGSNAGAGFTGGGGGETYHTRKGIEKILFYATIVVAVLFVAISIINLVY